MAASHVEGSNIPSAWINLDKEDSDPYALFHSIAQSLQYLLRDIDFSHLLSFPIARMETKAEIPLFREWTRSLFEITLPPLQVVLDGLDQLSADSPAFKFLQILVEDAPPCIHWIMLSREVPPLSLEFQHLKIRQQALVLRNEDLAFTPDEIREFFGKIRKIPFTLHQLEKIYSATEEWVGGLILLSEALSRFPKPSRGKYVTEELPDHFKREAFQYFAKEIFSSQAEEVQDFLTKSSILDLIEPGFMKDFTGIENSEKILRGFARRNLFVHSIYDEEKGWLFQYHQLFRDFLKVRFESAFDDEKRRSLFQRAGYLYVPRLRIETLGGFRVFRGDAPMEEKDWDRNRPRKLLKAIVSHGPQKISKEILIDDLWPEERPKAVERNFKTTLQRLRKSLEPALSKEFISSYIHLRDNYVFFDDELCEVDVDLFLSLLKKGEEKERKGDIQGALSSYAEAMEIYKGDFLPEEVYDPWVDLKREELKGRYIEFLPRMAKLYEKRGSSTKAIACHRKVIRADPLLEESYQSLMTLYSNRGMLNEAMRTYEECKKVLEKTLKTKPDLTTDALYKRILEKIQWA